MSGKRRNRVTRTPDGGNACGGPGPHARRWALAAGVFVVALAVAVTYWPVLSAQALFLDDGQYVVENRLIQHPSWSSAGRFLGEVLEPSTVRGYYQPLSMISLLIDYAIAGGHHDLRPFHRTSLVLHVLNAVLVVLFFHGLTGRVVPAVAAGLFFGLHPISVESVAWLSERKTLLATFFALCSLIAYVRYARRPNRLLYACAFAAYLLALLSKPTTIPLPILMLLLDAWPLRRVNRRSVLEKAPFFVMGCVAAVVTFVSQSRTAFAASPDSGSLGKAFLTICHNVVFYLRTIAWPTDISWFYPVPEPMALSDPNILAGVVGTCLLVVVLVAFGRRAPVLVVGSLFFLIAILPTMGIVGFTNVIAANRFAYLPWLGLLLIVNHVVAWGWYQPGDESTPRISRRACTMSVLVLLVIGAAWSTRTYLPYWRDTLALCRYMLDRTPHAAALHANLADALADRGRSKEAINHYRRAIELDDGYAEAHCNVAAEYIAAGDYELAAKHARRAVQIEPSFAKARYNLGTALLSAGDAASAAEHLAVAVQVKPDFALAHNNLAVAYVELGEKHRAISHLRTAVALDPTYVAARFNLASLLQQQGKVDDAVMLYRDVLRLDPDHAEARAALTELEN